MGIRTATHDAIATITLDRPDKLNAFGGTMREDLTAALRACGDDPHVRVVVITGAGRAFCAGGDVDRMRELQAAGDTGAFRAILEAGAGVVAAIAALSKPVIAAVNGVAAGAGCNLALACDLRIASDTARFSQSFVRIGLHPDWGGTWLLPRIVGRSRAFDLMVTGRTIDAAEALAIGLVDRVAPAQDLAREIETLAHAIAAAPPLAVAGIKRALAASPRNELAAQLALETEHQLRCFSSADAREGIAAFLEKRPPVYRGA